MSGRLFSLLAASLAVCAADVAAATPNVSYFSGVQPAYLAPIMIAGDTQMLPLAATFDNVGGTTIIVSSYVQDSSSCPTQSSSHPWMPYAFHSDPVPPSGTNSMVSHPIPFDTTAQATGTYQSNICIAQDSANVAFVPVRLTVIAGNLVPLAGDMTAIAPSLLGAEVAPDDTGSIPLSVSFQNNAGTALHLVGYVQDDPACPASSSVHAWVPLSTPIQGMVQANSSGLLNATIPLDATGLASGKFRTNICLKQDLTAVTSVIPVELRVVALDDIFQDGFD